MFQSLLEVSHRYQDACQASLSFALYTLLDYVVNSNAAALAHMFEGRKKDICLIYRLRMVQTTFLDSNVKLLSVHLLIDSISSEPNVVYLSAQSNFLNLRSRSDHVWLSAILLHLSLAVAKRASHIQTTRMHANRSATRHSLRVDLRGPVQTTDAATCIDNPLLLLQIRRFVISGGNQNI